MATDNQDEQSDSSEEEMVSFAVVRKKFSGVKPSTQTIRGWYSRGVMNRKTDQRVYLSVERRGGALLTSWERVQAFMRELNEG